MPHFLLSAAHKSSGKTTLAIGLCAAWGTRNLGVQTFKKGPDYIDPLWLGRASGRSCLNLDFHTMTHGEIENCFAHGSGGAELSLIEGNKGLHDGVAVDGSDANAALAKLLRAPVVLVVDTRGITRGIAPLLTGYTAFDPDVQIDGVILNQVGGPRHEGKLRAAVETYTDLPILGAVQRSPALDIAERHLGLQPPNELDGCASIIREMGRIVAGGVDLDRLEAIAREATAPTTPPRVAPVRDTGAPLKVGIARDAAFGFYYPDDLEQLRAGGAELVTVDTLRDATLPRIDALLIGGGFPEMHLESLEANRSLREQIRSAVAEGMPVYAECGGLMYLARRIRFRGATHDMVGAIPADVSMETQPQGRGYTVLEETGASPWPAPASAPVPAHEFHHSRLENYVPENFSYAWRVRRGHGIDGQHDGLIYHNVLASYCHLRATARHDWTARFLEFVRTRAHGRMAVGAL